MKIKNLDTSAHIWCGQEIAADGTYLLGPGEAARWAINDTFCTALFGSLAQVLDEDDEAISSPLAALEALRGIISTVDVEALPPFAEPLYRTKLAATAAGVTIEPGASGNIDFTLSAERWIYGGEGLIINAEPGDWFEAQVVDANSIIPEAYRAALCEASPGWPVVNTYVIKQWVMVPGAGQNAMFKINTYPLIAKVTQGLVLRTIYHATSAGSARVVYANIHKTMKLP